MDIRTTVQQYHAGIEALLAMLRIERGTKIASVREQVGTTRHSVARAVGIPQDHITEIMDLTGRPSVLENFLVNLGYDGTCLNRVRIYGPVDAELYEHAVSDAQPLAHTILRNLVVGRSPSGHLVFFTGNGSGISAAFFPFDHIPKRHLLPGEEFYVPSPTDKERQEEIYHIQFLAFPYLGGKDQIRAIRLVIPNETAIIGVRNIDPDYTPGSLLV